MIRTLTFWAVQISQCYHSRKLGENLLCLFRVKLENFWRQFYLWIHIFIIRLLFKVQTSDVSSASESEEEPVEKESSPEAPKLPPYLPAIQGCRSVEEFQWLNRIEEGTYGVVYRAKDKRTGEILLRFGSMVYYETPSDIWSAYLLGRIFSIIFWDNIWLNPESITITVLRINEPWVMYTQINGKFVRALPKIKFNLLTLSGSNNVRQI